jgi:hypothetical protein
MTMIVDGMTQKTTALPHFRMNPSWKGRDELGVHVEGIMVQERAPHLEFSLPNVQQDANTVVDTVHATILREQALRRSEGRPMPDVLYLQMDNVNTNKSKTCMAYLSWLVKQGIFKKVKVNFLLVGHTHENIDQLFSRFSMRLRQEDALTVEALMKIAIKSFTPNPTVEQVYGQRNWHEYLTGKGDFQEIFRNHAFRIKKIDGIVLLHSKQYGGGPKAEYRMWRSEATEVLPKSPVGIPPMRQLAAMKSKEISALSNLQRNLREKLCASYVGDIKEFWDFQVAFQDRVLRDLEAVYCPLRSPVPATYTPPAGNYSSITCPRFLDFHILSSQDENPFC